MHRADEPDPPMEKQKGRMRPVCEPQQQTVSTSIEEYERDISKGEYARSVRDLSSKLIGTVGKITIGRVFLITGKGSSDVDGDDVDDEECLAPCRYKSQTQDGDAMAFTPGRGVDEVGVELADELGWEGKQTEE